MNGPFDELSKTLKNSLVFYIQDKILTGMKIEDRFYGHINEDDHGLLTAETFEYEMNLREVPEVMTYDIFL